MSHGTHYRRDMDALYDRIAVRARLRADEERAATLAAQSPARRWRFLVDDMGRWVETVVVLGRTEEEAFAAVRQTSMRWALGLRRTSYKLEPILESPDA